MLPKIISSLSLTSGTKPAGVCADTTPARRRAEAIVWMESCMVNGDDVRKKMRRPTEPGAGRSVVAVYPSHKPASA